MKGSSCKHDIYKCTRIQTIKFWGKISNQVIKIKKTNWWGGVGGQIRSKHII